MRPFYSEMGFIIKPPFLFVLISQKNQKKLALKLKRNQFGRKKEFNIAKERNRTLLNHMIVGAT